MSASLTGSLGSDTPSTAAKLLVIAFARSLDLLMTLSFYFNTFLGSLITWLRSFRIARGSGWSSVTGITTNNRYNQYTTDTISTSTTTGSGHTRKRENDERAYNL